MPLVQRPPDDFVTVMIGVFAIAITAFVIGGAFLVVFWRALAREDPDRQLSRGGIIRLVVLAAVLLVIALILMRIAFQ